MAGREAAGRAAVDDAVPPAILVALVVDDVDDVAGFELHQAPVVGLRAPKVADRAGDHRQVCLEQL